MILTVHELKRLARNAAELLPLSAQLLSGGVQLELLTGIYDPHGMRSMLFAVLAVAAQLDRDYIREKTLEGQQAAPPAATTAGGWKCAATTWRSTGLRTVQVPLRHGESAGSRHGQRGAGTASPNG